ncbi:MAG: hypothetical protein HY708_01960 [Ignavibacteriae bacterium]|nr:hypothetical protein [Ignavibacteriota bacterium]
MPKARKRQVAEYRLTITPHFNELHQQHTTVFIMETAQAFASFRYELTVKEEIEENVLRYKILGLKTPQLNLPASGHAVFRREYENLSGKYNLIVEGLDGTTNEFLVRITKKRIQILKAPTHAFVEIVVGNSSSQD